MRVLMPQYTVAKYACSVHTAETPSLHSDSGLDRCVFLCLHILSFPLGPSVLVSICWQPALLGLACPCSHTLCHQFIAIILENPTHPILRPSSVTGLGHPILRPTSVMDFTVTSVMDFTVVGAN